MKTTLSAIAITALLSASVTANATDYQGWWWSAATDGMGLNVEQQGDTMAVAWYHFDEDRSPSYVLLAGKLVDGVLSGELQTASGPPPGPGYNPANVTRNAVGTATLTFKPSVSGSDQATATFEYTLNGNSGSFELARFAMQPTPLTSSWRAFHRFGGSPFAIMENTSGNHYRLTTGRYNSDGAFLSYLAYDLNLSDSGPVFTGNGRALDYDDFNEETVEVKRLQVENGVLVLDYVRTHTHKSIVDQTPPTITTYDETLVGFPPPNNGSLYIEGAGFYQSGWWWPPSKNGMGLNIEQQGDTIAVAWYHFDEDHSPTYSLLAGKLVSNTLSGELQTASGPPPGPAYDPADVSRETAGTATLNFTSATSATFEYTLNGRSGSLDLTRFTMEQLPLATGLWKYNAAYAAWDCFVTDTIHSWAGTASGIATMEKTGDKLYRLTTKDDKTSNNMFLSDGNNVNVESCTYDLKLIQSGSIFTGSGRSSCTYGGSVSIDSVTVRRLQTENGVLVFDYTLSPHSENRSGYICGRYGSLSGPPYDSTNP